MTRGKARKGSTPSGKKRRKKQRTKDRYAHAREDAQLEGIIPTSPEESLKPEVVPSSAQTDQPLPELIAQAARNGWATPDERKPKHIDELAAILNDPNMPAKVKIAAFNALRQADQVQYERDHPEEAGKAKGGGGAVNVSVQTNLAAVELLNKMLDDPSASLEDCASPDLTSTPGDSGHIGQVEGSAAPQGNQ